MRKGYKVRCDTRIKGRDGRSYSKKVVMLAIPATTSMTDIMRYVSNVLNFSSMLFNSVVLLSSIFFCSSVLKGFLLFEC